MNELSSTARALVDAARDEAGLPADQRARVRARVVASAGGASVFGSLFAKTAAAKLLGSPIVAWGALAVTVAGAGAAYTLTRPAASPAVVVEEGAARRATVTPASAGGAPRAPVLPTANDTAHAAPVANETQLAAPAHTAPAASESLHAGTPGDDLRPRRVRAVETKAHAASGAETDVAPPSGGPSASAETGFAEDARLLRDVRAALSSGRGERALALLEAREANSASGVFAEEREAAKIVTLCTLGRPEARAAAARFLSAHGTSPLAERVRRACPR